MTVDTVVQTDVAIVGAGPAGLLAAHLLARAGVGSVAVDVRTRKEIEASHRAGILEAYAARLLVDSGVSDRILRDGHEHEGIHLRFGGRSHRIDLMSLVGESVWLYPQTDVFIDLADARARDGGDVRFGVSAVTVEGVESEQPTMTFTDADGARVQVRAAYVIGTDGSRSMCRNLVPDGRRVRRGRDYPYAWFGVMVQAPPSCDELVYAAGDTGFALVSQRTATTQRLYFQCDATEDVQIWDDDRIWARLQTCLAGVDGFRLTEGPVLQKSVLPFRSFVQEPMRWGRLMLAGDAAHTVPPTGARGLNLAIHDVVVLAEVLPRAIAAGNDGLLEEYAGRALGRVWRAESFAYWMTQLLHLPPAGAYAAFDRSRQLGELDNIVSTRAGQTYLAEQYTGWPHGE